MLDEEKTNNDFARTHARKTGEYLDAVHDGERSEPTCGGSSDGGGDTVLYLKDWHFQRLMREGKNSSPSGLASADGGDVSAAGAMETPSFFRDDWLNWW